MNKFLSVVGVLLAVGVIFYFVSDYGTDTLMGDPQQESNQTVTKTNKKEKVEENQQIYKSTLDPLFLESTEVSQWLLKEEKNINALAVGFTTMASFLDMPESIPDYQEMQKEFELSVQAYEAIFEGFSRYEGTELQKLFITKLVKDYRLLFEMRTFQMANLTQENGLVVINYEDSTYTKESITAHWKNIVAMHNDFGTVTGKDYTGGLGALMN